MEQVFARIAAGVATIGAMILRSAAKGASPEEGVTSTAVDADHQALDVAEQFAPVAEDNTNGVYYVSGKKVVNADVSPSIFRNAGADASKVVKATPGHVYAFSCANTNAAARFLQLWDGGTSGTLITSKAIPGQSELTIGQDFFTAEGLYFATSLTFAFSTDRNTFVAGTAGEQTTEVVYQ